ncbi:MAG: sn-glycerol-1-phosphate dehydrogenase, partial [Firmicutes bacterium]|nr:sn-glycerol-1-phosphate dehydrogenase [Bacillota bacterium]
LLIGGELNTHRVAGEEVCALLTAGGFSLREIVFSGPHLHVEEKLAATLMEAHPDEYTCLVAVGSGTITDRVRLGGHRVGRPFVAVPTAASMDGYTSPVVPMLLDGVKQATPATPPVVVVADLDFVASAPTHMTLAGLGDLVGKITARADWILANLLCGEEICRYLADLSVAALKKAQSEAAGVREARFSSLAAVMEGLLLSGLAMQMVGTSRPASGAEHHLAHHWEERDLLAGREGALHGTYVGLATPFVAAMLHRLAALSREEMMARVAAGTTEEPSLRLERWEEVRTMIRDLVPAPATIRAMLREMGAPAAPQEVGLGKEEVLSALWHAHERRPRFTSLRLVHRLGLMEDWAPAIVAELV